jgi:hypothetical protein
MIVGMNLFGKSISLGNKQFSFLDINVLILNNLSNEQQ